ncbi:MAG: PhnD/SsuA/transferrin family substrate-binding protein [Planctomycetota bacterium]
MKALLVVLLSLPLAAEDAAYVILKTGERFAVQEKAEEVLADFAAWVAPRVGQPSLVGRITNRPDEALTRVRESKPLFAIVTPAFYLEHREALGLALLAQTRRRGLAAEKYAVIARKGATETPAKVATSLMAEEPYLRKVALAGGPSSVDFAESSWIGDDVAAMAEGDPEAPEAVLVDRATLEFLREDEVLWGELSVTFESADLPPDAVVAFSWTPEDVRVKLSTALLAMKEDVRGKEVCDLMQTDGFGPVDEALWAEAGGRWSK